MQGKQKRGPCLCCSQVAVSVTAAHVWLERLGIGSAASLTLAANLIPAAFGKLFDSCFCTSCVCSVFRVTGGAKGGAGGKNREKQFQGDKD